MSMEIPEVFREYTLENDPTYLYQIAQAIIFLQKIYGPIPKVWGKGKGTTLKFTPLFTFVTQV